MELSDELRNVMIFEAPPGDAADWAAANAEELLNSVRNEGAVLIRGLKLQGSKKLERVITSIFGEPLLEYNYRSTPRTQMRGRVYTSSEYHPAESILLHNENSYSNIWPMYIVFCCIQPAVSGGATPIADSRKIYNDIPADIREEFENKGLLYVRNYSDIDLPWSEVFQTTEKTIVDEYCKNNGIHFQWFDNGSLRTEQFNNATCVHPYTGEKLWFNQAHLFHVSGLPRDLRDNLESVLNKCDLPRNVYFGVHSEIEESRLEIIRGVYDKNTISFKWRAGDVLMLDNMKYAHGRQPYAGDRRILTAMVKAVSSADKRENIIHRKGREI